ncbi:unnamed protein product [Cladocopium goreaui]|uniref:Uncharacterized protein n=1 Tax=Cladocopium goreaui TaxID=2562237 RepID=A0A9P1D6T8_9DINO|nr:unnamed protein product [Cladocopium goreaui]
MDCSWGAVQMKLLDRRAMKSLADRLETLMLSLEDGNLPDTSVVQFYELVGSTQLACLYKGLQSQTKVSQCLPKLKQALAHPKQWLSRACKARNLLCAWDIAIDDP